MYLEGKLSFDESDLDYPDYFDNCAYETRFFIFTMHALFTLGENKK